MKKLFTTFIFAISSFIASHAQLVISGTNQVSNGGTSNTTFTAYSVICAGTTSTGAFQNVSGLGTSGQVLQSNGASALPTWQTLSGTTQWTTSGSNIYFNSGNVGIGSSSPSHALHVVGSIKMVDGNQGTNKVLTSDANGVGSWQTAGSGSGWALDGNTVGAEKFIGTLDNFDFPIRVNNIEKFRIKKDGNIIAGSSTNYNLSIGQDNGYYPSLAGNIWVGDQIGITNTVTGTWNVAIGRYNQRTLTSGTYNTSIGDGAMQLVTSGSTNCVMGAGALEENQTGSQNVAVGFEALHAFTGGNNCALGYQALLKNTTTANDAFGAYALTNVTTGQYNSAFGQNALLNNVTGVGNCGFGQSAGSATTGSYNSFFGYWAGRDNTGTGNVDVGWAAGFNNTGSNNTSIGFQSGLGSGSNNISIGYNANSGQSSGNGNITICYNCDLPSTTGSNQLNIGNVIYSNDITAGKVGIGTTSPSEKLTVAGRIRSTNSDIVVESNSRGLILKDTQSTPHYWRITISNTGVLTTTDVGTSLPSE